MIDKNPIRIACSLCDRVKTALALVRITYLLLPVDWFMAVVGIMAIGIAVNAKTSTPGYWFVVALAVLSVPYVLYMFTALFWRPVPFFRPAFGRGPAPRGEVQGVRLRAVHS